MIFKSSQRGAGKLIFRMVSMFLLFLVACGENHREESRVPVAAEATLAFHVVSRHFSFQQALTVLIEIQHTQQAHCC